MKLTTQTLLFVALFIVSVPLFVVLHENSHAFAADVQGCTSTVQYFMTGPLITSGVTTFSGCSVPPVSQTFINYFPLWLLMPFVAVAYLWYRGRIDLYTPLGSSAFLLTGLFAVYTLLPIVMGTAL